MTPVQLMQPENWSWSRYGRPRLCQTSLGRPVVSLFRFEHKHFTLQEAFLTVNSSGYRHLFVDLELRNLSFNIAFFVGVVN